MPVVLATFGLTDDARQLDECATGDRINAKKVFPAMRWLVVLIATFIALAALTELQYRDFPPQQTRPMPAVNVP